MELINHTLRRVSDMLIAGDVSSVELTEACLRRIEATEPYLNTFISVCAERAMQQARSADHAWVEWRRGKLKKQPSRLNGMPLAIKDVLCVANITATAGSRMLETFIPAYDATVSARLRAAGAVFLGKTNTDEFAMGSSTENSGYGPTRNPWDQQRVPGGSSGGSAASVAANLTFGALGTDTGGSVRQPASLCGVVGLKPSYGRISRFGLIAFGSSFDQVGTLTRTAEDAAILLQTLAGPDAFDATCVPTQPPDYLDSFSDPSDLSGLRIGIPNEHFVGGVDAEVEKQVRAAIKLLAKLGAEILPVRLPRTEHALPAYYLIANAEASANLARYDGIRYGQRQHGKDLWETYVNTRKTGFGPEVKRRIMLGTHALATGYYDDYYLRAQKVRTLVKQDFDTAFDQVDVIAGPTTPTTAFKLGAKTEDPLQMYLSDIFTLSANLAGIPGVSLPCGMDKKGLPIGLQLLGPAFKEQRLLKIAHKFQLATDWHQQDPIVEN